jgi:thiamine-phosphate pyrophosphorylase
VPAAPKREPLTPREGGAFPAFYPIIDLTLCARRGIDPEHLAQACLRGGARLLQLRQKDGGSRDFLALVEAVVALARPYGGRIVVNDRADVTLMAGAAGVHVGQSDLPPSDARRVLGRAATIGLSTHDEAQIDAALESDVDYIAVGPIFPTSTKETGYSARGVGLLRYAAGRGKRVVAIGGITIDRAPELVSAGATAVAVIADLLVGDPEERTRQYVRALA